MASLLNFLMSHNAIQRSRGLPETTPKHMTEEMAQELFREMDANMNPKVLQATGQTAQAPLFRVMYQALWDGLIEHGFKPKGPVHNMI